jgi:hypothetical protein
MFEGVLEVIEDFGVLAAVSFGLTVSFDIPDVEYICYLNMSVSSRRHFYIR